MKTRTKQVLLSVLLTCFFQTAGFSQEWTEVGCPQDEEGRNIPVFDLEAVGSTLYAGTREGVWQSSDHGMQWEYVGLAVEIEDRKYPTTDLLFHDDVLYAAADQVYRRTSGGDWELVANAIDYGCSNPQMSLATINGHLFTNIPQCNGKGLYRLTDMTGTWDKISDPGNLIIWSNGEIMYAGKKNTTDGENWSSISGVKGKGAIYSYTVTNGRYYLGAYTVTNTDAVSVSEDGTSFSSFTDGLWKNTTGSSLVSYGDTVFCLTQESDYLENRTNHVQWTDGESTRWRKLGDPLYMAYDRSTLLVHGGWLYAACNGAEHRRLESGWYEFVGGYGIWRYMLSDNASRAVSSAIPASGDQPLQMIYDRETQHVRLSGLAPVRPGFQLSIQLFSAQGRKVSDHRITPHDLRGGTVSIKVPNRTEGVMFYRIESKDLEEHGRFLLR